MNILIKIFGFGNFSIIKYLLYISLTMKFILKTLHDINIHSIIYPIFNSLSYEFNYFSK